jgi:uncharacterized radical SAM superfamily protein
MKITTFNPLILTKDAESIIKLFEDLGFERRHTKEGIDDEAKNVRMKDANGFHIDICQTDRVPHDITYIRMNVDDFDEAFDLLTEHEFRVVNEGKIVDTGSSKLALMKSQSGFGIDLSQHIKK